MSASHICVEKGHGGAVFAGRIVDEKGLRLRIFKAGVELSIRREVWQYLLGMCPPGKTGAQRKAHMQELREEYQKIKAQWTTITDKQAARLSPCTLYSMPSLYIRISHRHFTRGTTPIQLESILKKHSKKVLKALPCTTRFTWRSSSHPSQLCLVLCICIWKAVRHLFFR